MIVLSSALLPSDAKLSSLLQNHWDYPSEEALNLETLSFLLNFVTGQLLRKGCLEQFMKNGFRLGTVELVNGVVSCLDIRGKRSTGSEIIEQQCCSHCKRLTSSFSTKSHVALNEVSTVSLISWFRSIKPCSPKRCCDNMVKDDIKCFVVSLPEILIINSHGALLEKVITTDKCYENLMKPKYREVKQYSAIAALYRNKITFFKRNSCFIIQENGDVRIAEETVVTKNATLSESTKFG